MEPISAVEKLIASYKKLPGIGNKTAERLAYATLNFTKEDIDTFVSSLENVKTNVHQCPTCGMFIDTPFCPICDDQSRDDQTLMVLTSSKSIISFEKTNIYRGKYFILGGSISPIKGVNAKDIHLPELHDLVVKKKIKEVIIACDSTLEGEITSNYISKFLEDTDVTITRLAYGLPIGADLEYVDELTIARSLKGRTSLKGE